MNVSDNQDRGSFNFGLSPRQSEVLLMISNGYSNKEIANALEISTETVKTHLKIVFQRTQIRKRSEAIRVVGWA